MKILKKYATLFIISLVFSGAVLAHPFTPPQPNVFDGGNNWLITYYNDPAPDHRRWATQSICFLPYSQFLPASQNGTGISGVWFSNSFNDWNGRYYQEGDELKMTGDFANNRGHDHMTLQHTTYKGPVQKEPDVAFKDWTEWVEDQRWGRVIGWGNAKLVRRGRCPFPTFPLKGKSNVTSQEQLEEWAHKQSLAMPPRLTVNGAVAESPGQADLESLEEYERRTGLKK